MSVSGGTPLGRQPFRGDLVPEQYATPPVTVESPPLSFWLYTCQHRVGGGNDSGASIDSFNETTGQLFDDTFVSVSPTGWPAAAADKKRQRQRLRGHKER